MSSMMTGHYWKVSDNVFKIQIAYDLENEKVVTDFFSDWITAGEGIDPKKHKKISIFTKTFINETDFNKVIRTLNKTTIILKEAA